MITIFDKLKNIFETNLMFIFTYLIRSSPKKTISSFAVKLVISEVSVLIKMSVEVPALQIHKPQTYHLNSPFIALHILAQSISHKHDFMILVCLVHISRMVHRKFTRTCSTLNWNRHFTIRIR